MIPHKKVDSAIYEKALSWFWIILFIGSVFYLRDLLADMNVQTARLVNERERFRSEITDIQEENEEFYDELQASVEEMLEKIRK